jgi:hypothetical protein
MHGLINVKSPNNTSKWQMGFNSAFKGLIVQELGECWLLIYDCEFEGKKEVAQMIVDSLGNRRLITQMQKKKKN